MVTGKDIGYRIKDEGSRKQKTGDRIKWPVAQTTLDSHLTEE